MTKLLRNAWDELSLKSHGCIEASAGTGKTYTIEQLVVKILTQPEENPWNRLIHLEEILIVTYTEKATGELRVRIREILNVRYRELCTTGNTHIANHIESCLQKFDQAPIFTIHGFCNRYLGMHAFESNTTLHAEQADTRTLAHDILLDVLRKHLPHYLERENISLEQAFSLWNISSMHEFMDLALHLLTSYSEKKQDQLCPTANPTSVLVYYNNLKTLLHTPEGKTNTWIAGYANCKSLLNLKRKPSSLDTKVLRLQQLITLPNISDALEIISFLENNTVLWPLFTSVKSIEEEFVPVATTTSPDYRSIGDLSGAVGLHNGNSFEEFIAVLTKVKQAVMLQTSAVNYAGLFSLIRQAQQELTEIKQKNAILTFDDMIINMRDALASDTSPLMRILKRQFRYGIIDEFQDTNAHQWSIFKRLFVDICVTNQPDEKNFLYVVGDPKQSIFSFQGSDIRVYQQALGELKMVGSNNVSLSTNYRSAPQLVQATNILFQNGWFLPNEGIKCAPALSNALAEIPAYHGTVPDIMKKPVVCKSLPCDDKAAVLAKWIGETTRYLTTAINQKTPLQIPFKNAQEYRNLTLGDICILVEKHSEAQLCMEFLKKAGIPYTKQRNIGLFSSSECLHCAILLDALSHPDDLVKINKALLTHFFGFKPTELESPSTDTARQGAFEKIRFWAHLADKLAWGRLFAEIYNSLHITHDPIGPHEEALLVAALRQIKHYCIGYLVNKQCSLSELADRLRALNSGLSIESEEENTFQKSTHADAVRILTMHSSKGMEFPIVFIAAGSGRESTHKRYHTLRNNQGGTDFWLNKELCTEQYAHTKNNELRRLYYVALTRAKYQLFIPLWSSPEEPQRTSSSAASLFLNERLLGALQHDTAGALFSLIPCDQSVLPIHEFQPDSLETNPELPKSNIDSCTEGTLVANLPSPRLRMQVQSSYSALARQSLNTHLRTQAGSNEPEDLKLEQQLEISPEPETILVPGARTGDALHAILEAADFEFCSQATSPNDLLLNSALANLIHESFLKKGLLALPAAKISQTVQAAAELLHATLNAKISDPYGGSSIVPGKIPKSNRKAEMGFSFTFSENGMLFPTSQNDTCGYVTGFIDLLFEHEGRFYLLDWKSNWLPQKNYSSEALQANMVTHSYDLQYKLYSCALHAWLQQRRADYSPDTHFGGVIYIYLRGTLPGKSTGTWTYCPTRNELEEAWPQSIGHKLAQYRATMHKGIS